VVRILTKYGIDKLLSHSQKLQELLWLQNSNLLAIQTNAWHQIWPCPLRKPINHLAGSLLHFITSPWGGVVVEFVGNRYTFQV
jgi:hypothetical protein